MCKVFTLGLMSFLGLMSLVSCLHDEEEQKAKAAHEQALVNSCLVCHSANEMQRGPSLEGLRRVDFIKKVQNFQRGFRGRHKDDYTGVLMAEAVEGLSDNDLKVLADNFSSQEALKTIQTVRGESARGAKFYKARCASCHGVKGRGTDMGTALWTFEDWYLLAQLRKYRNGQRAYHEEDHDAKVMKAVVTNLNDQDLKDMVKYIRDTFAPRY